VQGANEASGAGQLPTVDIQAGQLQRAEPLVERGDCATKAATDIEHPLTLADPGHSAQFEGQLLRGAGKVVVIATRRRRLVPVTPMDMPAKALFDDRVLLPQLGQQVVEIRQPQLGHRIRGYRCLIRRLRQQQEQVAAVGQLPASPFLRLSFTTPRATWRISLLSASGVAAGAMPATMRSWL
jgi:hypothetical protein